MNFFDKLFLQEPTKTCIPPNFNNGVQAFPLELGSVDLPACGILNNGFTLAVLALQNQFYKALLDALTSNSSLSESQRQFLLNTPLRVFHQTLDGSRPPQTWHFDPEQLPFYGGQGLLVLADSNGQDTHTHVARPFFQGELAGSFLPQFSGDFDSFRPGTLLLSNQVFLHRRGEVFRPHTRVGIAWSPMFS